VRAWACDRAQSASVSMAASPWKKSLRDLARTGETGSWTREQVGQRALDPDNPILPLRLPDPGQVEWLLRDDSAGASLVRGMLQQDNFAKGYVDAVVGAPPGGDANDILRLRNAVFNAAVITTLSRADGRRFLRTQGSRRGIPAPRVEMLVNLLAGRQEAVSLPRFRLQDLGTPVWQALLKSVPPQAAAELKQTRQLDANKANVSGFLDESFSLVELDVLADLVDSMRRPRRNPWPGRIDGLAHSELVPRIRDILLSAAPPAKEHPDAAEILWSQVIVPWRLLFVDCMFPHFAETSVVPAEMGATLSLGGGEREYQSILGRGERAADPSLRSLASTFDLVLEMCQLSDAVAVARDRSASTNVDAAARAVSVQVALQNPQFAQPLRHIMDLPTAYDPARGRIDLADWDADEPFFDVKSTADALAKKVPGVLGRIWASAGLWLPLYGQGPAVWSVFATCVLGSPLLFPPDPKKMVVSVVEAIVAGCARWLQLSVAMQEETQQARGATRHPLLSLDLLRSAASAPRWSATQPPSASSRLLQEQGRSGPWYDVALWAKKRRRGQGTTTSTDQVAWALLNRTGSLFVTDNRLWTRNSPACWRPAPGLPLGELEPRCFRSRSCVDATVGCLEASLAGGALYCPELINSLVTADAFDDDRWKELESSDTAVVVKSLAQALRRTALGVRGPDRLGSEALLTPEDYAATDEWKRARVGIAVFGPHRSWTLHPPVVPGQLAVMSYILLYLQRNRPTEPDRYELGGFGSATEGSEFILPVLRPYMPDYHDLVMLSFA